MRNNDWKEHAAAYRPLVDTGRERLPVEKTPKDLDFTKTVGGTTYTVKSHFDPQAHESMLCIILRWMENSTDISASSL